MFKKNISLSFLFIIGSAFLFLPLPSKAQAVTSCVCTVSVAWEECIILNHDFSIPSGNFSGEAFYSMAIGPASADCTADFQSLFLDRVGDKSFTVSSECSIEAMSAISDLDMSFSCRPSAPAVSAPAKDTGPDGSVDLQAIKARAKNELNPMNFTTVPDLLGRAIGALLAFAGSIALVLYIYAGAMWMMAGGDPGRVGTAKKVIIWTTLGVVVMLGSYIIVREIFGLLK